jgi:hypothetical protein
VRILIDSHKNWLHRTVDRAILHFSYHEVIDGLWVGAFVDKKESVAVLGALRQALVLIRDNDPYRYRRVITRLDKIFVHPSPNQGEYVPELRRCVISTRTAQEGDIARIALTIVHEATHAELMDRGIGYGADIRKRVEEICSRQEMAFGRKLPDTAALLEEVEERMAMPAETWSHDASVQRDIDYVEQEGSLPKWLVRAILKLRERRLERLRRRQARQAGMIG